MFDAFKRSGKPGGNDWPRLVVLSIILSLRAYNADYDDDDDDDNRSSIRIRPKKRNTVQTAKNGVR